MGPARTLRARTRRATPGLRGTMRHVRVSLTCGSVQSRTQAHPRSTQGNGLLMRFGARREEYIRSLLRGWEGTGNCTAIGHPRPLHAAGAALVNGVAIHGEDFDDTLEGSPIR